MKPLAPHPLRPSAIRLIAAGGTITALGVVGAALGSTPALLVSASGIAFAGLGYRWLRGLQSVVIVNTVLGHVQADDLEAAEELGSSPAARTVQPFARRALLHHRADVLMRRGAFERAAALLDDALAIPVRRMVRPLDEQMRSELSGQRAIVAAALNDAAGARRAIDDIRGKSVSAAHALARAALAEALLQHRSGHAAEARETLRKHQALLDGSTDGRERAAGRALREVVRAGPQTPYRQAPKGARAALTAPAWVEALLPEGADFIEPAPSIDAPADAPAPTPEARRSVAASRTEAARKVPRTHALVRRILVGLLLVALGGALVLALRTLTASAPQGDHGAAEALLVGAASTFVALSIGLFVWRIAQGQRWMVDALAANRAMTLLASGETDAAEAIARNGLTHPAVGVFASASLALATIELRRLRPDHALALLDGALGRLERAPQVRAQLSDVTYPALLSARAAALTWLDRADEARAELALIPKTSPLATGARLSVEILMAARGGDFARAAALGAMRPPAVILTARDDLLADACRLASDPASLSVRERQRIRDALRGDLGPWVEAAAPKLGAALAEPADDAIEAERALARS